jgi:hypothetical protein
MYHRKGRVALLLAVLALAAVLLIGGAALAQSGAFSTEPGGEYIEAPGSFDSADWMVYADIPAAAIPDGAAPALEGTGEAQPGTEGGEAPLQEGVQFPAGLAPDDNPPNLMPGAPGATFSYYTVSGATLRGRSSSTEYVYDGVGCVHVSAGSGTGRIINTELSVPDGSILKYLRVYYKDTNNAGSVSGYITRYTPGTASNDLVNVSSTSAFNGGFGFAVSREITQTVNNASYAYTLIGWPSGLGSTLQVCGLRVAYYAPVTAAIYLPMLRR